MRERSGTQHCVSRLIDRPWALGMGGVAGRIGFSGLQEGSALGT
jgi:hypothetical protein